VVTYNSESVILSCLASIEASTVPSRIVVIDNGSNDATVEIIARNYPNIPVYAGVNLGFAGGCNRGIQFAGDDVGAYFFLNPDAQVSPTCLELLMKSLDDDPSFAVVSPTILHSTTGLVQYAGASLDFKTMNFDVFTPAQIAKDDATQETGRPAGAAMLVRGTSLEVVGPMNDSYFLYWEECEWAARFQSAGLRIGYVPTATVLHSLSHSTGGMGSRVYEYYYTRNFLRLVAEFKHMSKLESVVRLLPFIVRRLRDVTSRRYVMRLVDAIRFDALGILDFLRGRVGHRTGLPPITIPGPAE
jgi:N-acetylglucosaminyl-diphospho-decaprenol L-rhamnosyltransferase